MRELGIQAFWEDVEAQNLPTRSTECFPSSNYYLTTSVPDNSWKLGFCCARIEHFLNVFLWHWPQHKRHDPQAVVQVSKPILMRLCACAYVENYGTERTDGRVRRKLIQTLRCITPSATNQSCWKVIRELLSRFCSLDIFKSFPSTPILRRPEAPSPQIPACIYGISVCKSHAASELQILNSVVRDTLPLKTLRYFSECYP